MANAFSDPGFLQYALALSNARAGGSGIRGMVEGREIGNAMQDAMAQRKQREAALARRARMRKALEAELAKSGQSPGRRMTAIAGLEDPGAGLMDIRDFDQTARERREADEAMTSVGSVYGGMLEGVDKPGVEQVRGLLGDPDTVQAGVTAIKNFGLLDGRPVPEVTEAMIKEFTPASIQDYVRTGDYSKLQTRDEGDAAGMTDVEKDSAEAEGMAALFKDPLFERSVGPVDAMISSELNPMVSQERQTTSRNAEMRAQNLLLRQAESMGGVLSDTDIKILQKSIPSRSDDESTWYSWYNTTYLPVLNKKRRANRLAPLPEYTPGSDDAEAPADDMTPEQKALLNRWNGRGALP